MSSLLGLKVKPSTATVLPRGEPPHATTTLAAIARLRASFSSITVSTIPVRHFWPVRNQRFFCSRLRSGLLLERLRMRNRRFNCADYDDGADDQ
jgi:hypothetical protein